MSERSYSSGFHLCSRSPTLNAIERAALAGHSHIVEFLAQRDHGAQNVDVVETIFRTAANSNDKVLGALLKPHSEQDSSIIKSARLSFAMASAASRNDLPIVLLFLKNGVCPHTPDLRPLESPLVVAVIQGFFHMTQSKLDLYYDWPVNEHSSSGSPMLWGSSM